LAACELPSTMSMDKCCYTNGYLGLIRHHNNADGKFKSDIMSGKPIVTYPTARTERSNTSSISARSNLSDSYFAPTANNVLSPTSRSSSRSNRSKSGSGNNSMGGSASKTGAHGRSFNASTKSGRVSTQRAGSQHFTVGAKGAALNSTSGFSGKKEGYW
jgi:hypothetical protein